MQPLPVEGQNEPCLESDPALTLTLNAESFSKFHALEESRKPAKVEAASAAEDPTATAAIAKVFLVLIGKLLQPLPRSAEETWRAKPRSHLSLLSTELNALWSASLHKCRSRHRRPGRKDHCANRRPFCFQIVIDLPDRSQSIGSSRERQNGGCPRRSKNEGR